MKVRSSLLVRRFYEDVWNNQNYSAASQILAPTFVFRGSLGSESVGIAPFLSYVRDIHAALGDYRCEILELIAQGANAAAKMRFSGRHREAFLGFLPTGSTITWHGAAFFKTDLSQILELWVLGDLDSLKADMAERRET